MGLLEKLNLTVLIWLMVKQVKKDKCQCHNS